MKNADLLNLAFLLADYAEHTVEMADAMDIVWGEVWTRMQRYPPCQDEPREIICQLAHERLSDAAHKFARRLTTKTLNTQEP